MAGYGYENTGPLEQLLIEALRTGSNNKEEFSKVFDELSPKIRKDAALEELRNAEGLFNNSLEDNENEYVKAVLDCFEKNSVHYSPKTLENYWDKLLLLERPDDAQKIFNSYFSVLHSFEPEFEYTDYKRLENIEIKEKILEIIKQPYYETPMPKVVRMLSRDAGNFPQYFDVANGYSEDAWYELLKSGIGQGDIGWYDISRLFERRELPEYKATVQNMAQALRKISQESRINLLRLKDYKDEIDETLN